MKPCERPRICTGCGKGPRRCGYRGGVCSTCYRRRNPGHVPKTSGPCLGGCGDAGGYLTGFCKRCYQVIWKRTRAWRRATSSTLTLYAAIIALNNVRAATPVQAAALGAVRRLVRRLLTGEIAFMSGPAARRLVIKPRNARGRYVVVNPNPTAPASRRKTA